MVSRSFRELSWSRAARARELAAQFEAAREALLFFGHVAEFQANSVPVEIAWAGLPELLPSVCTLIRRVGTDKMKTALRGLASDRFEQLLARYWERQETDGPDCLPARILLQPFVYRHSLGKKEKIGRAGADRPQACPRCSHAPQVGLLRGIGHGRALSLVCALCLHEWESPRNACTFCGKERRKVLVYYSAEEFPARSLQCCNACGRYLHLIDLEEEVAAVADADEIAGLILDVWAVERGFKKQQLNMVGI